MAFNEKKFKVYQIKIKFRPITSVEVKSSFSRYISALPTTRRVFDFHNKFEYVFAIKRKKNKV